MKKLFINNKEFALTKEMKEDLFRAYPQFEKGREINIIPVSQEQSVDHITGTTVLNLRKNILPFNSVPFNKKRVVADLTGESSELVEIRVAESQRKDGDQFVYPLDDTFIVANPNIVLSKEEDLNLAYFLLMVSGQIQGNKCPERFCSTYVPLEIVNETAIADLYANRMKVVSKAIQNLFGASDEAIRALGLHFDIPMHDVISISEIQRQVSMRIDEDKTTFTADLVLEYIEKNDPNLYEVEIKTALQKKKIVYLEDKKTFNFIVEGQIGSVIMTASSDEPLAELERRFRDNPAEYKLFLGKVK
jgi:hypothetical protein